MLVFNWNGQRVEAIGVHLKSKLVRINRFHGTPEQKREYEVEALKARIKLATEAANVRAYIDARFTQEAAARIFVLGDMNDGPGKEFFERQYLFFDLVSTLQGDVFFARRFLNHALFDFADDLQWSVHFRDPIDTGRDPQILLDHILFTQALVDGSSALRVQSNAGFVEHEIHDRINAQSPARHHTSDHKPISCVLTTA